MIIFGWYKRRHVTRQQGQFYCPNCCVDSTYAHVRLREYFHIFFIPIIRTWDETHGIRCRTCQSYFEDDAIYAKPAGPVVKWRCPNCGGSWPESNICCPICKVRPDGSDVGQSRSRKDRSD
jgi:hypothetical protein